MSSSIHVITTRTVSLLAPRPVLPKVSANELPGVMMRDICSASASMLIGTPPTGMKPLGLYSVGVCDWTRCDVCVVQTSIADVLSDPVFRFPAVRAVVSPVVI